MTRSEWLMIIGVLRYAATNGLPFKHDSRVLASAANEPEAFDALEADRDEWRYRCQRALAELTIEEVSQ